MFVPLERRKRETKEHFEERVRLYLLEKWNRKGHDSGRLYKKECANCGREFVAQMHWRRFCSEKCRPQFRRQAKLKTEREAERYAARFPSAPPHMNSPLQMATNSELAADGCVEVTTAATFLSVSKATIWKMIRIGKLPHLHVGRRCMVPRVALQIYVEEQMKWGIPDRAVEDANTPAPARRTKKRNSKSVE